MATHYENPLESGRQADQMAKAKLTEQKTALLADNKLIDIAMDEAARQDIEAYPVFKLLLGMNYHNMKILETLSMRDVMCGELVSKIYRDINDLSDRVAALEERFQPKFWLNKTRLFSEFTRAAVYLGTPAYFLWDKIT